MKHWYAKPNKLLTEYVRTILIIEGFTQTNSDSLPIFTNGMPTLFCKSKKNKKGYEDVSLLSLFGKSPTDIWMVNKHTTIIAYFFKPFVTTTLFKIPANKLSDKPFDLGIWNPHKHTALKTQLIYAKDTLRKIEVIDNLIIQQLNENKELCKIVQYSTDQIMNNTGKEIISEILETLNLNERTFQRTFKKYVGVTPTHYRRVCRFQQAFRQLHEKQFDRISEVAYDNSFSDQSHFIRSFKEFTQITPNDYLKKGLKPKNG